MDVCRKSLLQEIHSSKKDTSSMATALLQSTKCKKSKEMADECKEEIRSIPKKTDSSKLIPKSERQQEQDSPPLSKKRTYKELESASRQEEESGSRDRIRKSLSKEENLGTTITIFSRRDFFRYQVRRLHREAKKIEEEKQAQQAKSRKTFTSILV